jgi:DNA topoisomerase-3
MAPYANVTAPVLAKKIPMSKKIFDNSKVTDHHAIIPTGESPLSLVGDEKKMYHLIAMRFIAAFYPDCIFSTTTVLGSVEKIGFKAVGKVIVDPGWRALFAKDNEKTDDKDAENDDNRILPPFVEGESGPHVPALNKKTTQPPKLYTEGTLLRAMETAGKNVDEEELREAMKENGIGRPSTRSAIIETLFKRRYIRRERKNIVATQAGIDLISTIHEELLKSAKLTGLWENKLRRIERGDYSAAEFLSELKQMVSQIVYNVLNDNSGFQIKVEQKPEKPAKADKPKKETKPRAPRKKKVTDLSKIKCPKCGKGYIIKGRTAYGCSNYSKGCDMLLPFTQYSAELTPQELYDKLNAK